MGVMVLFDNFIFRMPRRIEVGFKKSREVVKIVQEKELKKILIVVDKKLKEIGLIDPILKDLEEKNTKYDLFDSIEKEPTVSELDEAIKMLDVGNNYDGVVGIGGGSSIDSAKLLAVLGNIETSLENYYGIDKIGEPGLPMIMIPTTSGTGAEATPNAIVKDEKENKKVGIVSQYLIPDIVIIDPELTISLPPQITAETGIDAFTHAIECFICKKANKMSNLFALEAMKLIYNNIKRVYKNGKDKVARYNMALGSLYGGIAITNSGTGAVHALAYPLGGKYGISHGLSNAVLLTEVMAYNASAVPEKFIEISKAIGLYNKNVDKEELVKTVLNEIREMVQYLNISIEKINININEKIINDLANLAMSVERLLKNNPRSVTIEDAKEIYKKALLYS